MVEVSYLRRGHCIRKIGQQADDGFSILGRLVQVQLNSSQTNRPIRPLAIDEVLEDGPAVGLSLFDRQVASGDLGVGAVLSAEIEGDGPPHS